MPDSHVEAPLAGRTVLFIDDSKTIRRSAELFLSQAGCRVLLAEDGLAALAQLADCVPDVVFCDLAMPRLDGVATCLLVKQQPHLQNVPWIVVTQQDTPIDRARAQIAGYAAYLTKPFTKDQLLQCVAHHARIGAS